jgi:hypothetical protein
MANANRNFITRWEIIAVRKRTALAQGLPLSLQRLTPPGSFIVCKEQNIAGLASQGAAEFLQRVKINSHCLAFF